MDRLVHQHGSLAAPTRFLLLGSVDGRRQCQVEQAVDGSAIQLAVQVERAPQDLTDVSRVELKTQAGEQTDLAEERRRQFRLPQDVPVEELDDIPPDVPQEDAFLVRGPGRGDVLGETSDDRFDQCGTQSWYGDEAVGLVAEGDCGPPGQVPRVDSS